VLSLPNIELDPLIVWTRIRWEQIFRRKAPIKVEIGFGNGAFLTEMAQRQPGINFVGLEVYKKGIKKAIKRIQRAGLTNVRVIRVEASASLPKLFSAGEIAEIFINFPDPWPKRRHRKRRLITPSFVDTLHHLLEDGGKVYLATDFAEYAEEIRQRFLEHGGFIFSQEYPEHTPTKFEQIAIDAGCQIYYMCWQKKREN